MGMSLLYSPFFAISHAIAPLTGYEADGFSAPYKLLLQLSSIFYLALGLYFLQKTLRKYFAPGIVAITLIGITAGTNLYYYASFEAPLSHVYSFFLFSLFIWLTLKWHEIPKLSTSLFLGLTFGLISLIRPSNSIILLFFFIWGITNNNSFSSYFKLLSRNYRFILLGGLICFLVWMPQLIYWKYITGTWFYYSYDNEKFFFSSPEIINGLFSYRKGWLLYSPLMGFALIGIGFLYKNCRNWFWPVNLFIVAHIYIITSWWTWWYGGSFGMRPMIESYVILAFPLAALLTSVLKPGKLLILRKVTLAFVFSAFTLFSLFQTAQYYYVSIHWDSMSREAYWDSFLHLRPSAKFESLLSPPDCEKALKGDLNQ